MRSADQEATLAELKARKKEIEEQIKILTKGAPTICGRARFDKDHYATARPDEWCVYIKRSTSDTGLREGWHSIIRSTDKETAIGLIPEIVEDLQSLFNTLCEELRRGEK